jgi:hypothetical protein
MMVMRHARISPPELLITLSRQVEIWEARQKGAIRKAKERYAAIRRDLDRMNTDDNIFKKAAEKLF